MNSTIKIIFTTLLLFFIFHTGIFSEPQKDFSVYLKKYPYLQSELNKSPSYTVEEIDHYIVIIKDKNLSAQLIIFDTSTKKKIYQEDYNNNIKNYTTYQLNIDKPAFPKILLLIEYVTLTGSGCYGSYNKLYSIENNKVKKVLERPKYEYNTGWNAFEEDLVTFDSILEEIKVTENDLIITFQPQVILETNLTDSKSNKVEHIDNLPPEIYKWDKIKETFVQIKGRITRNQNLMSGLYSDFATVKGNWFKVPKELK
ncbi:MAG: hypothetical protein AB1782_12505 [Cyanobacteriota bacterium]